MFSARMHNDTTQGHDPLYQRRSWRIHHQAVGLRPEDFETHLSLWPETALFILRKGGPISDQCDQIPEQNGMENTSKVDLWEVRASGIPSVS